MPAPAQRACQDSAEGAARESTAHPQLYTEPEAIRPIGHATQILFQIADLRIGVEKV